VGRWNGGRGAALGREAEGGRKGESGTEGEESVARRMGGERYEKLVGMKKRLGGERRGTGVEGALTEACGGQGGESR